MIREVITHQWERFSGKPGTFKQNEWQSPDKSQRTGLKTDILHMH